MPPNPPSKGVALPRAAWRFAPGKYPHFSRKILNPPRNEILDTPLTTSTVITYTCGLQKPPFCNDNGYKFELKNVDQIGTYVSQFLAKKSEMLKL